MLYFDLINFSKFFLIFDTALSAAAPFKSVVLEAALAEVLGSFYVFVEEIFTLLNGKPNSFATICAIFVFVPWPISIPP